MSTIEYTLTLTSDAEVGSGLGNELVNDVVARDHLGQPVIRGSHLKGLLRETLADIATNRNWPNTLHEWCFGRPGGEGDDGVPGLARFGDARPVEGARVRTITRTSLTELGVATGTTLRTTEAIAAGTPFRGVLHLPSDTPAAADLAIRLALLALDAVGGGRSRGSGACHVTIEGESHGPGALLMALDADLARGLPARSAEEEIHLTSAKPNAGGSTEQVIWLRLVFRADDPVCCPETPVVSNNVLRSGLGIPASAVQGALVARLAAENGELATRSLADRRTRSWPLLPCGPGERTADLPTPVWVALSHRMSKVPDADGSHLFKDAAIEPYDWRSVGRGSPLKGGDGLLLRGPGNKVRFWRSGDVPRVITAHAVHFDPTGEGKRNLYTVEALAPTTFVGLACFPATAARRLLASLATDPVVCFGKARTVRGGGRLEAMEFDPGSLRTDWQDRVFVLQSPAAIPDDWDASDRSAEALLERLVRESGWGEVEDAPRAAGEMAVRALAACGVRFGWNRHGIGTRVGSTRRLRARRVFLPGSVFVLKQAPQSLEVVLRRGLGVEVEGDVDARAQGFGAVLPHPGVATSRYTIRTEPEVLPSKNRAGELGLKWWRATAKHGPSPSQIAAVRGRITDSGEARLAIEHLENQRTARSKRIWERWETVHENVLRTLTEDPILARDALRTWQDLVIANAEDGER